MIGTPIISIQKQLIKPDLSCLYTIEMVKKQERMAELPGTQDP